MGKDTSQIPDAIRERIVQSVADRLNTISSSNGYGTDPGTGWMRRVTLDPNPVAFSDAATGFVYREDEQIADRALNMLECTLTIVVEVYVSSDGDGIDSEVDGYLSDVEQAVMVDPTWSNLATQTFLRSTYVETPGEGENVVRGQVRIEVQYQRDRAPPILLGSSGD